MARIYCSTLNRNQLTKNQIIAELFVSQEFNHCISRMHPDYLRDDLKAEVAVVLCEMDGSLVRQLHSQQKLTFYIMRVMMNMVKSNSSPFHKKYRQICKDANFERDTDNEENTSSYSTLRDIDKIDMLLVNQGHIDMFARMEKEKVEEIVLDEIEKLHWYEHDLLMLYIKVGTYRAVEKETGIPHESVGKTLKSTGRKIRKRVYEQCRNNNIRLGAGLLLGELC